MTFSQNAAGRNPARSGAQTEGMGKRNPHQERRRNQKQGFCVTRANLALMILHISGEHPDRVHAAGSHRHNDVIDRGGVSVRYHPHAGNNRHDHRRQDKKPLSMHQASGTPDGAVWKGKDAPESPRIHFCAVRAEL